MIMEGLGNKRPWAFA